MVAFWKHLGLAVDRIRTIGLGLSITDDDKSSSDEGAITSYLLLCCVDFNAIKNHAV